MHYNYRSETVYIHLYYTFGVILVLNIHHNECNAVKWYNLNVVVSMI